MGNKIYAWFQANGLSFFCISIFILYLSSASYFVQDDIFTSVVFAILLLVFLIKQLKFDSLFFATIIVWFIINIFSSFININQDFPYLTLIGVTLRIVMPYLIVKIIGVTFFDQTIKYAYILSIIGLLLFSIQLLATNLFYGLAPYLNLITQQEQSENGGWYIFIYMFSSWAPYRNCGFAWEPGGYSCIITILLAINLVKRNFKLDKISLVFLLSIITTLSTSGYLALFLLFIAYVIANKNVIINPFYLISLIVTIIFAIHFYQTSDFLGDKIDTYVENADVEYNHFTGIVRINRIEEFNRALDQSWNWPLGNGVFLSEYRLNKYGTGTGSNSFASILTQWGWLGLILFFYSLFMFFYFFTKNYVISLIIPFSITFVLFSNPFSMRYIVFALFFYYFIHINKQQNSLEKHRN